MSNHSETLKILESTKEELVQTYNAYIQDAIRMNAPEDIVEMVRAEAAMVMEKIDRAIVKTKFIIAMN